MSGEYGTNSDHRFTSNRETGLPGIPLNGNPDNRETLSKKDSSKKDNNNTEVKKKTFSQGIDSDSVFNRCKRKRLAEGYESLINRKSKDDLIRELTERHIKEIVIEYESLIKNKYKKELWQIHKDSIIENVVSSFDHGRVDKMNDGLKQPVFISQVVEHTERFMIADLKT